MKPVVNTDAQIKIKDYNVFRADRKIRDRGGALLYCHESIPITQTDTYDDDICEAIVLKSAPNDLIVACVYKPCNATDKSFTNLLFFLHKCINEMDEVDKCTKIIFGDLNFPDLWKVNFDSVVAKSNNEHKLLNFMNNNFLCQYVDVATRQGNILDLLISNSDRLVHHITSEKHEISDHNLVEILIPTGDILPSLPKPSYLNDIKFKGFRALNLFDADFTKISESLEKVNWEETWSSCPFEDFPKLLYNIVLEKCQEFSPSKTPTMEHRQTSYQRSYRTIQRKRRKLNGRLRCLQELNPSSPQIPKLQMKIRKFLDDLKHLSYSQQTKKEMKAIEKIKTKPRYFFSYAKKLSKTKHKISQLFKKDGTVITDRKLIADTLQDQFCSTFSDPSNPNKQIPASTLPSAYLSEFDPSTKDIIDAIDEINRNASSPDFSIPAIVLKNCKYALCKPLLLMWRRSLDTGVIPAFYKQQLVTPIYKKGSRSLPLNYRPVSLTAHEIKIFERIVRVKMVEFLEKNHLLKCNQHGFRKGRSCLTQLLKQYDDILMNMLNHDETDVIYVDFAKAFDKVDHDILIQKLKNIGVEGKLLNWLIDFLSDRNQVVVVDNTLSYIADVLSGVPQGTVLGPLLFLIFLNDLSDCINHCDLSCFADDTRIYKSISFSHDAILLQEDLLNLADWSTVNNMKLHDDKFVFINFHTRHKNFSLSNLPFYKENMCYTTKDGHILESSEYVTDLGVTFSEKLDWSSHISTIVKKAKQKAGWALNIFRDRSPLVMKTLYKSVVRSHLEYCCPLWTNLSLENLRDLESVQRSFTNKIICPPYVENYWDRLEYLQIMSLQRRRERYAILHIWKVLHEITSNDLGISFYESRRFGIMANVPPLNNNSNQKAKTLYDLSFAVIGPRLWNVIPKDIKDCDTLITFKCNLDKFLFETFPDHPPISGYAISNNNSILDWSISRNDY